jgi:hypothetical protein
MKRSNGQPQQMFALACGSPQRWQTSSTSRITLEISCVKSSIKLDCAKVKSPARGNSCSPIIASQPIDEPPKRAGHKTQPWPFRLALVIPSFRPDLARPATFGCLSSRKHLHSTLPEASVNPGSFQIGVNCLWLLLSMANSLSGQRTSGPETLRAID